MTTENELVRYFFTPPVREVGLGLAREVAQPEAPTKKARSRLIPVCTFRNPPEAIVRFDDASQAGPGKVEGEDARSTVFSPDSLVRHGDGVRIPEATTRPPGSFSSQIPARTVCRSWNQNDPSGCRPVAAWKGRGCKAAPDPCPLHWRVSARSFQPPGLRSPPDKGG